MDSGAVDDGGDKGEAFRKLCSHYRRGCSLVVSLCTCIHKLTRRMVARRFGNGSRLAVGVAPMLLKICSNKCRD